MVLWEAIQQMIWAWHSRYLEEDRLEQRNLCREQVRSIVDITAMLDKLTEMHIINDVSFVRICKLRSRCKAFWYSLEEK